MPRGLLGRGLAVLAACLICFGVAPRNWWSYQRRDPFFGDPLHGTIGPHLADSCHDRFCSDLALANQHRHELGTSFVQLGALLFYGGLATSLCAAMTALAERRRAALLARVLLALSIAVAVLALATFLSRGSPGDARFQLGPGFPAALAGAALGALAAILVSRDPAGRGLRRRPAAAALSGLSAVLILPALLSHSWWHWSWSDERNRAGLRAATRCWERGPELCVEEPLHEIFMLDHDEKDAFRELADRTYYAGLALCVLLAGGVIARVFLPEAPELLGWTDGPCLLVLLLATVTVASVPHMGPARIAALGWPFPVLVLGCLAGVAGSLLTRKAPP